MVMRRGCRGHPDSKAPGDNGETAASEAEWSIEQRLGVSSGLSPAPLLSSHVTLKATYPPWVQGFPSVNSFSAPERIKGDANEQCGRIWLSSPSSCPSVLILASVCFSLGPGLGGPEGRA